MATQEESILPPTMAPDTDTMDSKESQKHPSGANAGEKDPSPEGDDSESGTRYNLRLCSQVNRVQVERRKEEPKKLKPKSRPPPLSKYRRKTANSRERSRMNEINDAFEDLRKVIPDYPTGKMTKITTLRLALNYMGALREMLGYSNEDYRSSSLSSPEPSDGGSTGSVSDCSSPGSCGSSNSPSSEQGTHFENSLSDSMDIDTDASLKQLFELKLDSSLSAPLDTSLDDVFSQASSHTNPVDDLFAT